LEYRGAIDFSIVIPTERSDEGPLACVFRQVECP
jgi:hypothetical protein